MSLKLILGRYVRAMGRLPGIKRLLYHPSVRAAIQTWPGFRVVYGKDWYYLHPFDQSLGTDTSGFVESRDLPSSPFDLSREHVYAGSQPSIVRSVLAALPPLHDFTFIDFGCGKGRPLMVASEFPFRDLVGVELSPPLVAEARKNVGILQKRFPGRVPLRVHFGDACTFPYPAGNLVIFLYNPFGKEVIARVVAAIEAALAAEKRSLYVVYYNPVYGAYFDASPALTRYFAGTLPYAEEERGFGPDNEDPVVIWQAGDAMAPHPGADARINIIIPGARAELACTP